jgi:hypothetical protein
MMAAREGIGSKPARSFALASWRWTTGPVPHTVVADLRGR